MLFCVLLAGCASVATNVALVNIMAAERSIEPEKPKKLGAALPRKRVAGPHVVAGAHTKKPALHFSSRFGQWQKTDLPTWSAKPSQ
jgi:hypothetical protein